MKTISRLATLSGIAALLGAAAFGCGDASFFADDSTEARSIGEYDDSSSESESDESLELSGALEDDLRGTSDDFVPGMQGKVRFSDTDAEAPVDSWVTETSDLAVENLLQVTVPYTAYIHVHDGGVLFIPFWSLEPGETEIMPAPKESPEQAAQQMEDALVDAGYSRTKAEQLVAQKREELFERHGSRVGYIAPDSWVEQTERLPLGGTKAPSPPWK